MDDRTEMSRGGAKRPRGGAGSKGRGTADSARAILRGELENIGLPTLLTILDMERRSGLVVLKRDRLAGRIQVRDGRVVRAIIEPPRNARIPTASAGREAVYEMLAWTDGQFELWQSHSDAAPRSSARSRAATESDSHDEVGESTTFLLMEAARRADEAAGIVHQPTTDADAGW